MRFRFFYCWLSASTLACFDLFLQFSSLVNNLIFQFGIFVASAAQLEYTCQFVALDMVMWMGQK